MEDILHQIACLTVYIALPIPGGTGFLPSTVLQMRVYNVDIHKHSWYVQYILFFQILLQHLDDGAWGFSGHVLSPGGQDLNLTLVLTLHEIVSRIGFMHNTLSLQTHNNKFVNKSWDDKTTNISGRDSEISTCVSVLAAIVWPILSSTFFSGAKLVAKCNDSCVM